MTVIYLTDSTTRCYAVTFENNGNIKVQKFQDVSDDEKNVYCVKPLEIFLGKSKKCNLTTMSRAFNKSVFDGKTILLKISEENNKHRYV